MPYCRKCGTEVASDAAFCANCGAPVSGITRSIIQPEPTPAHVNVASWGERIIAWIIDMIAIGIIITPVKLLIAAAWPSFIWAPDYLRWIPFVDVGMDQIIYFFYWTFLEGTNGQSLGKMIMRIRVTQLNGEPIEISHAAIASIGKAFLLPIDLLLGWIMYPNHKQRLFNHLSETIVTKSQ